MQTKIPRINNNRTFVDIFAYDRNYKKDAISEFGYHQMDKAKESYKEIINIQEEMTEIEKRLNEK